MGFKRILSSIRIDEMLYSRHEKNDGVDRNVQVHQKYQ